MDSSGDTTSLHNCPDCGTPVGERHKPGYDVGRCRACGIDMGHPVWTGEYPVCVTRSDLIGYGLVLSFYRGDGHLCGKTHRRHDELVAEIVTTLGPDRCLLDSVQGDNDVTSYIFFVEPCGDVPSPDQFTGLGEKYGPCVGWLTTHYDGDEHETIRFDVDGEPASPSLAVKGDAADGDCGDGEFSTSGTTSARGRPAVEQFQNASTSSSHECPGHEWVVFSTALAQGWLMLQCVRCGRHGTVDDPSKTEWSAAFHAPSAPYRWTDDGRVTRRDTGPLYVRADGHGGYERLWREVIGKLDPLGDDERAELLHLAGLAEGPGDLDSGLFPLFVTNFELDTGVVPCPGVKRAAERIRRFHQKGVHLSPRQVAWALRCYANESPPAVPAAGSSQPPRHNPQC